MAMTVPRQTITLLGVLINQSQAARLNRAQDVSPELVRQLIHRLSVRLWRSRLQSCHFALGRQTCRVGQRRRLSSGR